MTAEHVEQVPEPKIVTGDFPGSPVPRPVGGARRFAPSHRRDRRVVAERDWVRCAVVRFVRDVETAAPFDEAATRYRAGERMRLWQCGREGRPVDRRFWHTSLDLDDTHFIPAEAVEVIEVLEDTPPFGPAPISEPPALRRWLTAWPNLPADDG